MKWNNVRTLHPSKYVLLKELKSHIEGNKRYVDEVECINAYSDRTEAFTDMLKSKDKVFVYHTASQVLGFLLLAGKH
jgi:hypothetical protein